MIFSPKIDAILLSIEINDPMVDPFRRRGDYRGMVTTAYVFDGLFASCLDGRLQALRGIWYDGFRETLGEDITLIRMGPRVGIEPRRGMATMKEKEKEREKRLGRKNGPRGRLGGRRKGEAVHSKAGNMHCTSRVAAS